MKFDFFIIKTSAL